MPCQDFCSTKWLNSPFHDIDRSLPAQKNMRLLLRLNPYSPNLTQGPLKQIINIARHWSYQTGKPPQGWAIITRFKGISGKLRHIFRRYF